MEHEAETMSLETLKQQPDYSSRDLFQWALEVGQKVCLEEIGKHSRETRYFKARARRLGVDWPEGFFQCTLDQLASGKR